MSLTRRRFLTISASAAFAGGSARAALWQGQALGADVSLSLRGQSATRPLINALRTELGRIEQCFSLHRASELTELNRTGRGPGSRMMREVLGLSRRVNRVTDGLFDPCVQSLWAARVEGRRGRLASGVQDIEIRREICLPEGARLTFNGVAQGYATDRIAALLQAAGFSDVLIDMGEMRALGGDFRVGIGDPAAGVVGQVTLKAGRALATSSPAALRFADGSSHIIGPQGQPPVWSSVTVEADSAAIADAASTAFVLMERARIEVAARRLGLHRIFLTDLNGDLSQI